MILVTAIHLVGGSEHQHIAEVRWKNTEDGEVGTNSRAAMVQWITHKGGIAELPDHRTEVVSVVDANPPFLRARANEAWTDALLALPRY